MIDHLADLESDFSAVHRVDDIFAMDGPRFMRMAWRLPAYQGVMRMRFVELADTEPAAPVAQPHPGGEPERGVKRVSLVAATVDATLSGLIDVAQVSVGA